MTKPCKGKREKMLNMVEQLTNFNSPVKVHGNTINEILSRQQKVQTIHLA